MEFDPLLAAEFLTAIKAGATVEVASAHADLDAQVVRGWLKSNPDFARDVRKARADLQLLATASIRRDVKEDSRSARYLAESIMGDMELERLRELTT